MTLPHGGGVLVRGAEAEKLALPANVTTLFVEGAQTNGAFSVIRATLEAGAEGARPHHHAKATELFFVIAGAIDVLAGDSVLTVGAGDLATAPPGAMHAFANASASEPADMLIVFGPGIERFDYFRLLRDVVAGTKPGSEILASQERFDNWFGESEPWKAHLAKRRGG
jgi:mannose-6-phosphate isomerase-like protein (cupin superfamily)